MSDDNNKSSYVTLEYLDAPEYLLVTTLIKLNEARKQNVMLKSQLEYILNSKKGQYENENEQNAIKRNTTAEKVSES